MKHGFLSLSQLSDLTGVKRHTLNARLKSNVEESELVRTPANHIALKPDQTKIIINPEMCFNQDSKVIFIGNLKGGVGKTTIAYLLCITLASLGLKTCAIDLDVQANLTNQFIETNPNNAVFLDLIENKVNIDELPIEIEENLSLIPSSLKNGLIQKALTMQSPKHHVSWLNKLCLNYLRENYDVIIVDTPPSLSTLNSVFCLCLNQNDSVLIPVAPEEFSILGVQMFLDDINEIRNSYGIEEDMNIKIIMNRFFQTQKSNLEILVKMTEMYGELFSGVILRDISKIRELMNKKLSIAELKGGKDIYEFMQGLLKDLNLIIEGR